jgi:fumarate reductase flavoprotein subunit
MKVDDTSIISVKVLVHNETKGVGSIAVEQLPAAIVKAQSVGVDTIAGATVSSKAIIEGVKSALSTSGVDMKVLSRKITAQNTNVMQDATTDVVVVGGGGAGMSAAIEAKSQGLNVILVEKLPIMGGTTALASTAFNAGGSSIQLGQEKPYTADDYYKKLLGSKTEEDPSLRRLADLSGKTADWLIGLGADLSKVINGSQHIPKDGRAIGAMIVPKVLNKMDALKIDYRTNSKATKIIMDGERL